MKALRIVLALIFVSSTMAGQTALRKQLRVRIEKLSPTSFGFNVLASVTNLGSQPVFLAEAAESIPATQLVTTLQSLDVQQWDEKLGWQSV